MEDEYYPPETKVVEGKHCKYIITIRHPILTPEERERRMNEIDRAASRVILAYERQERERLQKEGQSCLTSSLPTSMT